MIYSNGARAAVRHALRDAFMGGTRPLPPVPDPEDDRQLAEGFIARLNGGEEPRRAEALPEDLTHQAMAGYYPRHDPETGETTPGPLSVAWSEVSEQVKAALAATKSAPHNALGVRHLEEGSARVAATLVERCFYRLVTDPAVQARVAEFYGHDGRMEAALADCRSFYADPEQVGRRLMCVERDLPLRTCPACVPWRVDPGCGSCNGTGIDPDPENVPHVAALVLPVHPRPGRWYFATKRRADGDWDTPGMNLGPSAFIGENSADVDPGQLATDA